MLMEKEGPLVLSEHGVPKQIIRKDNRKPASLLTWLTPVERPTFKSTDSSLTLKMIDSGTEYVTSRRVAHAMTIMPTPT